MSSTIKPNILINITSLFQQKGWKVEQGKQSLFERFCERLKLFSAEQQEFIIEITQNFKIIGLSEYLECFYSSFLGLGEILLENKNKIYVYPLIKPYIKIKRGSDKILNHKTKSSQFLHYMIDADDWRWVSNKLIFSQSIKKLKNEFNNEDSCLILIDDFVGTGKTAVDVCEAYLAEETENGLINPENIKVVSLAAQISGMEYVKNSLGIDVISDIIIKKGITDYYVDENLENSIHKMTEIETTLKIDEEYQFGYGKSEALISFLKKTPNNTFPVFWHETKNKVAPFPRYKVFQEND